MDSNPVHRALILSVDLDMWYHCRWATGGPNARWETTVEAQRAVYGAAGAAEHENDLPRLTENILKLFHDFSCSATFFILGEMALRYPGAVRSIQAAGHEIASHGMRHCDASRLSDQELRASVADSRKILEDISGQQVTGFRYPNLVFTKRELATLMDTGYCYDSSVCFSRKLFGKFGASADVIPNPYRPSAQDPFRPGDSRFWEFPIPVFPHLRLPAGSGIATRLMGPLWTMFALNAALATGDTLYYFHPFDLHDVKGLRWTSPNAFFFLQNTGQRFERQLRKLLGYFAKRTEFMCVREWLTRRNGDREP